MQRFSSSLLVALAVVPALEAHSQERLVDTLRDQRAVWGCSWSASSPDVGQGFILLAERDESLLLMNIGGTDVRLALDAGSDTGSPSRVGDRLTKTYSAPSIRVEATYTATWMCPPGAEGCEVTRFDVTFVVTKGDRTETVQGTGEVGC